MKWLAQFIAGRGWLVRLLISLAERTPYFHIHGPDGAFYMGRWWLLRGQAAGDECPLWLRWLPMAIRIHWIVRPDSDRHLHDHPFDYRTVILRGWYVEEDVFGERHFRRAGDTVSARAQTFHRIAEVSPGGVWTMFICGRRRHTWGFLVDGHKVDYRRYLRFASEVTP